MPQNRDEPFSSLLCGSGKSDAGIWQMEAVAERKWGIIYKQTAIEEKDDYQEKNGNSL